MAESSTRPRVILDLRCLQGPGDAGIGRFARDLVASRPQGVGPVIGLVDPRLGPPDEEILASLDGIRPDAYFPEMAGTVFVNPAPMAGDPLFIARLLLDPRVRRVAAAQDSGPSADSRSTAGRLRHLVLLAWARRYDLLLPTSGGAEFWAAIPWEIPDRVNIGRASAGRAKPKLAMLSPFPPSRSGVADYSAACAEALAAHAELTLFSAEPDAPPVAGREVAPLSALAHLAPEFDRVVGVLGNSHFHAGIHDLLARYGGAAICHDSRLLHFYAEKDGAEAAARLAGEELRREVSVAELALWQRDETRREAVLLGEVARHARPLIFHARASVELARARFDADARYLPFAIPHAWPEGALDAAAKRAAKCRLGLDPSRIHIASFGFVTLSKGVDRALAALRLLRRGGFAAYLHFVGEPEPGSGTDLNRAGEVSVTGYVCEARYRDYLLAADLGLQLRNTGAGSISGALADCIAAGLPTVANESLAAALDAPDYVARVADGLDPADIAGALAGLIETPPTAPGPRRAAYCAFRSMENYAARLCEILEI